MTQPAEPREPKTHSPVPVDAESAESAESAVALAPAGTAAAVGTASDAGVAYDASNIQVLEGLEAVRKRPGMYIGSTGERGLHHLVYEVVDNSVDEALAGHCDRIEVTLLPEGAVRVRDNGRGIPVDDVASEGRSAVEVVLTVLHAGGKFGGGGYKVSGGLHGVGVSVVNALSARLEVEIHREGHVWTQSYSVGVPDAPLRKVGPADDAGTTITFWASPDIFETTDYSFETLSSRFREMAFLNRGLTIVMRDERPATVEEREHDEVDETTPAEVIYKYDGGLVDYVNFLGAHKDAVHRTVVSFEAESAYIDGGLSLDVAMQWNTGFNESVHTFANTINTHEGGTHEEGFRAALTTLVNKFARDWNIIKEKDANLTGDDVREGLTAIVSVKLADPQFEGQTKTKLGNTEAKSFVQKIVNDRLGEWFEKNPSEGKDIARKAMSASFARLAARKARDAARSRKGLLGGGSLPGKLADCQSTNPEECELFIVEGDSAGGPAKQGRDQRTQAILPIRGKILNVERARIDRMLKNNEIQALITAIGAGVGEEFDPAKARYHKVVILADADVDGSHIRTLLLMFFYRQMGPLVEAGYVYIAQPPLYSTEVGKEKVYIKDDTAKARFLDERPGHKKEFSRLKGLGEMDWKELQETTMGGGARTLLQVTLEDAALADEITSVLMGDDVESRRNFIATNARDVRNLDF